MHNVPILSVSFNPVPFQLSIPCSNILFPFADYAIRSLSHGALSQRTRFDSFSKQGPILVLFPSVDSFPPVCPCSVAGRRLRCVTFRLVELLLCRFMLPFLSVSISHRERERRGYVTDIPRLERGKIALPSLSLVCAFPSSYAPPCPSNKKGLPGYRGFPALTILNRFSYVS